MTARGIKKVEFVEGSGYRKGMESRKIRVRIKLRIPASFWVLVGADFLTCVGIAVSSVVLSKETFAALLPVGIGAVLLLSCCIGILILKTAQTAVRAVRLNRSTPPADSNTVTPPKIIS
jgi:hypothetical protein